MKGGRSGPINEGRTLRPSSPNVRPTSRPNFFYLGPPMSISNLVFLNVGGLHIIPLICKTKSSIPVSRLPCIGCPSQRETQRNLKSQKQKSPSSALQLQFFLTSQSLRAQMNPSHWLKKSKHQKQLDFWVRKNWFRACLHLSAQSNTHNTMNLKSGLFICQGILLD